MSIPMEFDEQALKELKAAREAAVADGDQYFPFRGSLLDVTFAKYLIEFLEAAFKER